MGSPVSPRKTGSSPNPQVHMNMYVQTGSMQQNEAVMRSYWLTVGSSCRDWSPYKRRDIKTPRHTQRQEGHTMTEAETTVMCLRAEGHE